MKAFAELLTRCLPCPDALLLAAEPGIYLEAFHMIFNGHTCATVLPGGTVQTFLLCHAWRLG
ncbi:hypothetical protein GCM10008957_24490 [Deinococcus ruber]|uniref:Uncharacterized protein n=1 Tax=Deinococcus ruber TaxID=1848197 RepID=A0A918F5J2_9DEIO|nr:hypothetical protein GCM10008957_24490 [Deinococcus ruber]